MKIDIKVSAKMPSKVSDDYKHKDITEKARDYMQVCDSDMDSAYHWRYLVCLYNKLQKLPRLPEPYMELMEELERYMSEKGPYASGEMQPNMTGESMFKYRKDDDYE